MYPSIFLSINIYNYTSILHTDSALYILHQNLHIQLNRSVQHSPFKWHFLLIFVILKLYLCSDSNSRKETNQLVFHIFLPERIVHYYGAVHVHKKFLFQFFTNCTKSLFTVHLDSYSPHKFTRLRKLVVRLLQSSYVFIFSSNSTPIKFIIRKNLVSFFKLRRQEKQ